MPQIVGVLGGGRMGAGIAHVFASAGSRVIVVERDSASAEAANERLKVSAQRASDQSDGAYDADELMARSEVTTTPARFSEVALVIEAVPEDFELKVAALSMAESHLSEDAWLTTNTSSLSVSELAGHLRVPERLCGLHFFNPVPTSLLVEVVSGDRTAPQLRILAGEWVTALQKTPIFVNDAPGFASSRLGVALALEAMRMFEEGVASAADIDTAMVLGYRHAAGPLKTTDIVGLDVRLGIAEYLAEAVGSQFEPPQILRDKVARGELGRKSGIGFFEY